MFQVSICYCFWFDLFVLFVSGFYLLLFLIWPFRTVCFRFLSVIVFDWPFRTVCFRFLSVIVFDWPFRTVCFRFLSVIVFDLTFSYCLFQVSICYCFWFDLFVLFVSGFYLLLFLIWPFRTVCFRFLSVIVFDLTFSYCLFQVSICHCFWFDLFVLFVSGFYLLLFLIWPFCTVCFRFLSVIVIDLTFSYCLFQVSICYCFWLTFSYCLFQVSICYCFWLTFSYCLFQVSICYCFWFDFFVLFVSGFYLLLFLIWPFRTVCFRFLSVIVFDLTFSYCLFQVSICYCFWFDLFVLFASGFYLSLFLIWPFRTVCFRFLSVIVFDLTFLYCLFQVSICYCYWFDLFVLFVSGFYLSLFLIWPFRTVCFRFLSVIVFDLTFSYCLFQVSICYCFWFDLFVLFVSGFYLLLLLIWPFRTVCFRFLSVIVFDLTFSYCLFQVSICYCYWFDLFVLFVSGFYLLLLLIWPFRTVCFRFLSVIVLIWPFRTVCFRFLSVIVFDLTFSYCLFQVSICYCFWFDLFVLFVSGFYLLLFLIWLFRTVWFRFLSVIVIDLTFSKLFASGFYLLLFLIWLFSTVCFRILSVIVFDWPFRTVCFRFLSAIVFDLTFLHCLLQVSICYCFWFDLLALFASGFYLLLFLINPFVLFVSGFYLLLFLIWPFCTVCFRFLSVIVFDFTFSYCLFQVSICYCFWLTFSYCLFQVSICYCFWLTFSYCLFQVSICYCFWFDFLVLFVSGFYLLLFLIDLFVLFVSGFYLLLFLIWLFRTVCFRFLSVIVFDWPFRTVCIRFLSVIVFDLTFLYCLFQVSICYCFWFDLFVLFVSGFYLLLFLIWPFRTVCFRFLSVIVFDLTFSYCLFQVSICYCFWFDLFVLFVSGFYLLLFLIWPFRTVCFRFLSVIVFDLTFLYCFFRILSVIVFDLTFSYCLFEVSICHCYWFDLFVLFVSGFYLLLFLIWPFRTVCFRFLSVIVFDLTFLYCLFQVSICYCFWFDLFVLFVSGFYLLLFLIWPFRTVCFRFLSVIVFDLTFSYCLFQVSICYCFWFDLFVLFVSGFYLLLFLIWPFVLFVSGFYPLLFLIWPFRTVCFSFLSVIVFDLTFSYCLFQVSICYCYWFDLFVLFVSGFYLLLFLIWPFRTVCVRFLSVIVIDLTFSYCLFKVSICYCCWFDLFVLFVSGFYLLLFLIWPFRTVCFRFLSVIVIDLTFSYCLFQVSICYCFWFDLFVLFV